MTENSKEDFRFDAEQEQFLDALAALILADERRTAVLNFAKYVKIEAAHAILQALTRDMEDVKLTYELHQPFRSMGYISLEGESPEFDNPLLFARAVGLADNIEFYPLVNGRVRIDLAFNGLTKPIE